MASRSWEPIVVAALLGGILVFGVALRLQDPLSTDALPAEDPLTHVVFTKEWMKTGYFADSDHLGTEMYPPGMHAWLAAFVPFTGVSLYEFARIGPALLASIGLLGMFVLGNRIAGPTAGLAAAFLTAILPEHIFRTELLFPTAFDLLLAPLWLLGFHLAITTHRAAGSILFLGASVPFALMHPWAIPLFGGGLSLYAAIRYLRGAIGRSELWLAAALVVPPTAVAMSFRWDTSDTGFSDFLSGLPSLAWLAGADKTGIALFVLLIGLLGIVAACLVAPITLLPRPRSRGFRIAISLATGAALLASVPLLIRDLPRDVSYPVMFGWVALLLALAGFALAFARPTALGDLGVAICVLLFPLTALNLFDGPYWPQRTVAYLAVGVALLGASALSHLHAVPGALMRSERSRAAAGPAALVAMALVAAGTATAIPVNTYEWYRLYNDEQFAGFEEIVRILDEDPTSKAFVYTWQPALVVKTLTEPEHIWYGPKFFQDIAKREKDIANTKGPAYVLVDKYTTRAASQGKADLDFLLEGRYHIVYQTPDGALRLYEVSG